MIGGTRKSLGVSLASRVALAIAALGLAGCPSPEPPPAAKPILWQAVAEDLPCALLSVHGTAANDVWAVGSDGGRTGAIVHWDGKAWTRLESGTTNDLWWVHAFSPTDVFMAGSGSTIFRWDGTKLARMATPGVAAHTVYGLWGSSASDIWAVGGRAGHHGFLWHFDGKAWSDFPLPDDVPLDSTGQLPSLFKVWGRSASDIYAVGSNGLMLHFDGKVWARIATQTDELLFTVAGFGDDLVVVGGSNSGVALDKDGKRMGPSKAPLLQGVDVAADGTIWACGAGGAVWQRKNGTWKQLDLGADDPPQSLHAVWVDPAGGVWTVGGNVLTATLDDGALYYRGPQKITALPEIPGVEPPATACPKERVDIKPSASIARRWNELLVDSIRRDVPRPGVHARNLYHTSLAMHDAWAAYEPLRKGLLVNEKPPSGDAKARTTAISYAVYRVMLHRYEKAIGGTVSADCYRQFMGVLGLDPTDVHTNGQDPVALGNRIGQQVIDTFAKDGANEAENYKDITGYKPANPPLLVDVPGSQAVDPNIWQEMNLAVAETQNGILVESGRQNYIGSNWGYVTPFAAPKADAKGIVHDWPDRPDLSDAEMKDWVVEVIRKTAELDHKDGKTLDISPGAYGNNPLGTNDGKGLATNPVTGQPYAANVVARGDFTRVLAEFWADGPKSETPPGHWFVLANTASDDMEAKGIALKPFGQGGAVDRLAWDAQMYLTLGGAVHDAAITAWGLKRAYLGPRPITLVRHMAGKGQSSDPKLPGYSAEGLPLQAGLIELITAESSAPGQRHHHLRWWKGQIAVLSWLGEPGDRKNEEGPVAWMRGVEWLPYQRRTFVTPAFPGFISGHSSFSRAAAEVLAAFTGSAHFPGGLGTYKAKQGDYLVFENGPSADVDLQWATYFDAADQAGQSRIFGGIHIWPDDSVGRQLGHVVGLDAIDKAKALFAAKP
jgi:hypothetical protein